jgi:PAS domain S-box-containing protein
VQTTTRFLETRLLRARYAIIAAICLLDFVLIVALYVLLRQVVLKPLREVERYAVGVSSGASAADGLDGRSYVGELESLRGATRKMVEMLEARYAELRKSEARYRLLAENIGDVIWTLDRTGRVTYVSPSIEAFLGYTQEQAMEKSIEELLVEPSAARLRELLQTVFDTAARGGRSISGRIELENVRRDGRRVWAENTYELLHGPGGEVVGVVGVCRDITERRTAEAEREAARRREQEARKEYTRKLLSSQETERRRIASELHDSLGQNLLLIKNRAQLAWGVKGTPADVADQLDGIAALASASVSEVRQISHDLRPYQLDHLGLVRALRAMIDSAAESTTLTFKCKIDPVDDLFSPEAATQLYRVVQESLNNVLKHAAARHVSIELERDVHHVGLRIEDDGCGISPVSLAGNGAGHGFGLQNIAERVAILGGELKIDSKPGAGTRIEVTIPTRETPG